MTPEQDEFTRQLRILTRPPFNLSFEEARQAIRKGWAEMIIEGARKVHEQMLTNITAAMEELREEQRGKLAQKSEPIPRYFVCTKCNGNFAHLPPALLASCPCGAAKFGDDGSKPFSEMGIPLCTSEAFEVTELVLSGKLTPVTGAESSLDLVYFVNNRCKRNVEQEATTDASKHEALTRAKEAASRAVEPAASYIERAAGAGAKVMWCSHYHSRGAGIDKSDKGEFLKREITGDARFVGQVIVRDQANEADGSLIFVPVFRCARCQGDHPQPIAFWKLTHRVMMDVESTPGCPTGERIVATHFGFCPSNGEPIMMVTSEPTPEAEVDFTKPGPGGEIEAMKAIDGPSDTTAKSLPKPEAIGGVCGSSPWQIGYTAGEHGDISAESNPYMPGTEPAKEWQLGFDKGRKS